MRLLRFDASRGRTIASLDSRGATLNVIDRVQGALQIALLHLEPGGEIGSHPAAGRQLFLVVQGEGWVQAGDQPPVPVKPGLAALWERGERHGAGSETGLVAVVLESDALRPEDERPPGEG